MNLSSKNKQDIYIAKPITGSPITYSEPVLVTLNLSSENNISLILNAGNVIEDSKIGVISINDIDSYSENSVCYIDESVPETHDPLAKKADYKIDSIKTFLNECEIRFVKKV